MYDVRPEHYTTVIREMIRHENDVTNHRIMWLLVGQGFIVNAYVLEHASIDLALPLAGILVALSGFVVLYKATRLEDISSFSVSEPSRVNCKSKTCHLWDGQVTGSKAGGGKSGSAHGSGKPLIC